MPVEEVFSIISSHMAKGVKLHSQLSNAFSFLNLKGYAKCHEYHYYDEVRNYRELNNFYLENYNKLILEKSEEEYNAIPSNWYKHTREEVDINTKRTAIRDLFRIWVDWEKETRALLEKQYSELYNAGEICGALKIAEFIQDVSNELKIAYEKQIDLSNIGYDITLIVDEQSALYKEYQRKIKHIYKGDE